MTETITCPMCQETMEHEKDKDYFFCPDGCGEFWPAEKEFDAAKLFEQEIKDKKKLSTFKGSGNKAKKHDDRKRVILRTYAHLVK